MSEDGDGGVVGFGKLLMNSCKSSGTPLPFSDKLVGDTGLGEVFVCTQKKENGFFYHIKGQCFFRIKVIRRINKTKLTTFSFRLRDCSGSKIDFFATF